MGHHHDHALPKLPLYSAFALVGITLALVAFVRLTGIGELRTPQTAVTAERWLRFSDHADGSVTARDAGDGRLLERIEPGTNGFLRGTLRGLARDRKRSGIGPEPPLRLTSRSDGRLLLEDPSTGRLIDLGAFGRENAAVFSRLLIAKPLPEGGDLTPVRGPSGAVDHDQGRALAARPQ